MQNIFLSNAFRTGKTHTSWWGSFKTGAADDAMPGQPSNDLPGNHEQVMDELPGVASAYPEVLVLMAVFNGMNWLPEQLESILKQDNVRIKLLISVDLSDDNSYDWCCEQAQNDHRISVLPYGQRYGSATANFFRLLRDADFSQSDYVAFADQDDIWYQDKLSRASELMKRHQLSGYSSDVRAFWPDGRSEKVKKSQSQQKWDYCFEAAGPGCTYVLTPELSKTIQRFLSDHQALAGSLKYHDWFCYAVARHLNMKWYIDSSITMDYRQHQSNLIGVNRGHKAFLFRMKKLLGGEALDQVELTLKALAMLGGSSTHYPGYLKPRAGFGAIRLGIESMRCRRKRKDQMLFFLFCLMLSISGRRNVTDRKQKDTEL
ncbi:glycosyltransferase [Oceanospirillum sediminis]|nr:glycosyltransferase [Oceanospirillum sediminis]